MINYNVRIMTTIDIVLLILTSCLHLLVVMHERLLIKIATLSFYIFTGPYAFLRCGFKYVRDIVRIYTTSSLCVFVNR